MYEIISLQSDTGELAELNLTDVTELELMMQFPNLKGIENNKLEQFIDIFVNNLIEAIHSGELPASTDLKNHYSNARCCILWRSVDFQK